MVDPSLLTETGRDLLASAAQFRREMVAPNAAAWERARAVPADAIRAAAALGLTGIEVPRAAGGQEAGYAAKALISEELARGCMGFAFSLVNSQNLANSIARAGTKAQIERYLPRLLAGEITGGISLTEPHAGSDFPAISTRAIRDGDDWVLTGEKAWLTNAATAEVMLVYAKVGDTDSSEAIGGFIIDASGPGFERLPPFQLMGGHAIGVGGIRLSGYRASANSLRYPPGQGFKNALAGINGARTYVAAMCCGMVDEALRIAVQYATRRQSFGRRLLDHQGLRWSLAEVATDLEAARLLTYRAIETLARGENAMLHAAYAKKFAVRMAQQRLGDCLQAMGAEGLREHYPFGRHIACARIAGFVDGSTEMQNERIGAALQKVFG